MVPERREYVDYRSGWILDAESVFPPLQFHFLLSFACERSFVLHGRGVHPVLIKEEEGVCVCVVGCVQAAGQGGRGFRLESELGTVILTRLPAHLGLGDQTVDFC